MPRFSVIIPCFNRTQFLEQAVSSVLAQTVTSFEIIIIDDGSNKTTEQKIATICGIDGRIRLIRKNKNTGVSSARNTGLRACSGDYVCFLDDDDRIAPSFMQYALDSFDQQSNIDIALCRSSADPQSVRTRFRYHVLKETLKAQSKQHTYHQKYPGLLYQHPPQINSMVFRREVFDQFAFEESFQIGEDIYLWFKLLNAGFIFGKKQSSEALAFIRVHDNYHLSQSGNQKVTEFLKRLQADFGQRDPSLKTIIDFKLALSFSTMGNPRSAVQHLLKSMKNPVKFLKIAGPQTLLKLRIIISFILFKYCGKDM